MKHPEPGPIQRIQNGDASVFDDVVTWYAEDVLRLCTLILRDRHEAEDVLQESILRLVRLAREGKLRDANGSIKGFLLRCARNLCIDRLRRAKRLSPIEEDATSGGVHMQTIDPPDIAMETSRLQSAFDEALARLPGMQRTILVLKELNGESYGEIAQALDISIECVRKSLYRSRQKLRETLAPYRGAF